MQTLKIVNRLKGSKALLFLMFWPFLGFCLLPPIGKITNWLLKSAVPTQIINCKLDREVHINNIKSIATDQNGNGFVLSYNNSLSKYNILEDYTITRIDSIGNLQNIFKVQSYSSIKEIKRVFQPENIHSDNSTLVVKYFKGSIKVKEIKVSPDNNDMYILAFSYGLCPGEININRYLEINCQEKYSQRIILYKLDLKSLKLTQLINKLANDKFVEFDVKTGKITEDRIDGNYEKYYSINNKGDLFFFKREQKIIPKTKHNDYRLKTIGFKLYKNFNYYGYIQAIKESYDNVPFNFIGKDNNFYFEDYIFNYNDLKVQLIDRKGYYEDFSSAATEEFQKWSDLYSKHNNIFYRFYRDTILILDNNGIKVSNPLQLDNQITELKASSDGIFYGKIIPIGMSKFSSSHTIQIIRCNL
jgi:hypothetical protein